MTFSSVFIARLRAKAEEKSPSEKMVEFESSVVDMSGGNYDDAYDFGIEEGLIQQARDVLDGLGLEWVPPVTSQG